MREMFPGPLRPSGCYGPAEPGFGERPVAHDRAERTGENFSGLLNAQSTEEPQFDDLALAGINLSQTFQRVVEGHHVGSALLRDDHRFIQRHSARVASAFGVASLAGVVNQDLPH